MSLINKHIHLSEIELKQYIFTEHELTQIAIEHIELELQLCDVCSNKYVSLLENMEFSCESMLTEPSYEQLMMKIKEVETKRITLPIKKKWYENSLLHIAVAASITGILFISGLLSMMTNGINEVSLEDQIIESSKEEQSWFNLSEQAWVQQFEKSMKDLQQFKLFKEDN